MYTLHTTPYVYNIRYSDKYMHLLYTLQVALNIRRFFALVPIAEFLFEFLDSSRYRCV